MGSYEGIVYDIDAVQGGTHVQVLLTDGVGNVVVTTDNPGLLGSLSAACTTRTVVGVEYDDTAQRVTALHMRPLVNNVMYVDHDGQAMNVQYLDQGTGNPHWGHTQSRLVQRVVEVSLESGTPLTYVTLDPIGVIDRAKVNNPYPFSAEEFEDRPGEKKARS